MMDVTLTALAKPLAENQAAAEKYALMLGDLLNALNSDAIGESYKTALENGDMTAAVTYCAQYFRAKPDTTCPSLKSRRDYDRASADRAVRGEMREVNIDWTFEGGRINFLFDPTAIQGPRNHEWLWQLNRHSYWIVMACAYADTKDETYALAFERQLLDWISQTSCPETDWNGPGSAWRTIECGIRLLGSWQIAFQTFRHSADISGLSLLLMLASMHQQVKHLIAHPRTGNWLMMESNGVFAFAALYPEFREAEFYRKTATERLLREMDIQILPDGMHNELSPDYQAVVWSCASGVYELAQCEHFKSEFPPHFTEVMERTVKAAILLSTPGFTQPRSNDCYTIPTARFTSRAEELLGARPDYSFVNSKRREGCPPAGKTASAFLPYAGFCVMRSDWSENAAYLSFDVGPLGKGHMHQDKLNINLYKGEEELIFDDGGGQYEISPARTYGLSAYDHNTVLVDGLAQNRKEPLQQTESIDAGWISNERFDYAYGIYDDPFGENMTAPAIHKRQVRFDKPDFFCIKDELTSADNCEHEYEILFHLNTLTVRRVDSLPGAVISNFGRTYDVLILPLNNETEEETSIISGQTEPCLRGWYVGRNEETIHKATTVGRKSRPAKNHTFITLLFPIRKGDALPVISKNGNKLTVAFAGNVHTIDLDALNQD